MMRIELLPRVLAGLFGRISRCNDRLIAWLREMHDAGLRRYVTMIVGVLITEAVCPDKGLFVKAIDLHVGLRKRDMARRLQRRMGAGRVQ